MTYIVIELQTNNDGTVGNLVYSYADRNQAEQKYHLVLSSAAVSQLQAHAAVLLTGDGRTLASQCYRHEVTPPDEVVPEE